MESNITKVVSAWESTFLDSAEKKDLALVPFHFLASTHTQLPGKIWNSHSPLFWLFAPLKYFQGILYVTRLLRVVSQAQIRSNQNNNFRLSASYAGLP